MIISDSFIKDCISADLFLLDFLGLVKPVAIPYLKVGNFPDV